MHTHKFILQYSKHMINILNIYAHIYMYMCMCISVYIYMCVYI